MFIIRSLILRTTGQFAFVGPLIGGALYFIPSLLLNRPWNQASTGESKFFITTGIWIALSYLVGLLPAALTGATLGAIRQNKNQSTWSASAAFIGLLAGFITGSGIDIYNATQSGSFVPISAVFLAVPSCISALICSYLFRPIAFSAKTAT